MKCESATHRRVIRGSSYVCAKCGEDLGTLRKVADKFNDYLMSPKARPDLQTPEAQAFLGHLQGRYLTPQTDAMMPWVTREWKKGRILGPDSTRNHISYMEPFEGMPEIGRTMVPNNPGENPVNGGRYITPISRDEFSHWADWYNSDHPTRQGTDIMGLHAHDVANRVDEYNKDMALNQGGSAEDYGRVVHKYPDNWSIQELNSEKLLEQEGDSMGHCVGGGGYWPNVRRGDTLVYSLRDHKNEPHATMEITPNGDIHCDDCGHEGYPSLTNRDQPNRCPDCHSPNFWSMPQNGTMVQIQGKANEAPKQEYQNRIRNYFETMKPEDRPQWESQDNITMAHELPWNDDEGGGYQTYHHGDYGLPDPHFEVDWPALVRDHADDTINYSHNGGADKSPEQIAQKADEMGQAEGLRSAVSDWETETEDIWRKEQANQMDTDTLAMDSGYDQNNPSPNEMDYWDENARDDPSSKDPYDKDFDEERYNKDYAQWEKEREEAMEEYRDEHLENQWWDSDHNNLIHDWSSALYDHRNKQRAAHTLQCEACGDPLGPDGQCKRCDWGTWSEPADTNNPSDQTRDVKPAIQAAWEPA